MCHRFSFFSHFVLPLFKNSPPAAPRANALKHVLATAVLMAAMFAGGAAPAQATVTIQVTYTDPSGYGFQDATLGAQRRQVFQSVVSNWSKRLSGTVPIQVNAGFQSLGGPDSTGSTTLAQASPTAFSRDWAGWFSGLNPPPRANTWYPNALANQLAGKDINTGQNDIDVTVNSDYDISGNGFYYGLDSDTPANKSDFFTVLYHEMGHGLGFLSSWEQNGDFGLEPGYASIFDVFMAANKGTGGEYLTKMTQAERAQAMVSDTLWFAGANASLGASDASCRLYAPSPWDGGSSASHLDETLFTGIEELMTPMSSGTTYAPGRRVTGVFKDMGWTISATDTTLPSLGVTSPSDGGQMTTLSSISGTASDGGSGMGRIRIQLQRDTDGMWWNGTTWGNYFTDDTVPLLKAAYNSADKTWSYTSVPTGADLVETTYKLNALAWDRAGNFRIARTTFAVGQAWKPSVTVEVPKAGQAYKNLAVAGGHAKDDVSIVAVRVALRRYTDKKWWAWGSGAINDGSFGSTTFDTPTHTKTVTVTAGPSVVWNQPLPALPDGEYEVWASSNDNAGNWSEYAGNYCVINTVGPDVKINTPSDGGAVNAFTSITGEATDDQGIFTDKVAVILSNGGQYWTGTQWYGSKVPMQVPVDDGAWSCTTLPTGADLRTGTYQLEVSASDGALNTSTLIQGVNKISFVVDTSPPTCTVVSPPDGSEVNSLSTITGTADDAGGLDKVLVYIYRFSDGKFWGGNGWDSGGSAIISSSYDAGSKTWQTNGSLPQPGNASSFAGMTTGDYNIIAIAYDKAGNSARADSVFSFQAKYTWTGATLRDSDPNNNSTSWGTPDNWSPLGVPGPDDIAVIGLPDTVTSTISRTVRGFQMSAGGLDFTNAGDLLTVTKTGAWTGGSLDNTEIASTATLEISGSDLKYLATKATFNNLGTVNWTGPGQIHSWTYNPGEAATITNQANAHFNLKTEGDVFARNSTSYAPQFTNETGATFAKSGSGDTLIDDCSFINRGTVQSDTGTLTYGGTGNSGVQLGASTLSGTGTIKFDGDIALRGTISSTCKVLQHGGTVTGDLSGDGVTPLSKYQGTGVYTWNGGTIAGAFTLKPGALMEIKSPSTGESLKYLGGSASFNNEGTVNWTGPGPIHSWAYNPGDPATINNKNGANFNLKTDGDLFARNSTSYQPLFLNKAGAKLTKNGGNGETLIDDFTLVNDGEIISAGNPAVGGVRTDVITYNSVLTLNNGGVLRGPGLHKARGATTVNGETTAAGGTFVLAEGTATGTDATSVLKASGTGAIEWAGGNIAKTLTIGANTPFNITGEGQKNLDGSALLTNLGNADNSGAGHIYSGSYNPGDPATILNKGTFVCSGSGDFIRNSTSYSPTFENAVGGTFRKAGGDITNFDWNFNNHGTAEVTQGILELKNGGTSSGEFKTSTDQKLRFTGGTSTFQTGARFTGTGFIQVDGATVTGEGDAFGQTASPGAFEILSGELNGVWKYSGTGLARWKGGTIGGVFNLASGATMDISSPAEGATTKYLGKNASFNNEGTVNWIGPGPIHSWAYNPGEAATVTNKAGGHFNLTTEGDVFARNSTSYAPQFVNETGATFAKSGNGETIIDDFAFTNRGTIQADTGTLCYSGATGVNGGVLLETSTLSGTGTIRLDSYVSLHGAISSTCKVLQTGGTVVGDFDGDGITPLSKYQGAGVYTWTGGTIGGAFTLAPGATMEVQSPTTGESVKYLGGNASFNNEGTVNWTGPGPIHSWAYNPGDPATINNKSGANFNLKTDGDVFARNSTSYQPLFLNKAGAKLTKNGGNGETVIDDFTVINDGEVISAGNPATGGTRTDVIAYNSVLTLNNGGVLRGPGLHKANGTTTINGKTTATGGTLLLSQGTVTGPDAGSVLASSGAGTIEWAGGTIAGNLTIASNTTFNISGDGQKNLGGSALLTNLGTARFSGTGPLNSYSYNPSDPATVVNKGTFTCAGPGGFIRNSVSYSPLFKNEGTFAIGAPLGAVNMAWSYTQTANATLSIEIGGANAETPQFDQLKTEGTATLAGTLKVALVNGYKAPGGTGFKVLTFGARSGQFATVTLPFQATYNPNDVTLTREAMRPAVAIVTPPNNSAYKVFPTIQGTASDDGSGIATVTMTLRRKVGTAFQFWGKRGDTSSWGANIVSLPAGYKNGAWSIGSGTLPTGANLTDAPYYLVATAVDKAGNVATSPQTTVTIDRTLPVIAITNPVSKTVVRSLVISGTATEANLAKVEVTLTRKVGATTQYWGMRGSTFSWGTNAVKVPALFSGKAPNHTWAVPSKSMPAGPNLVEGPHNITATATDRAGNATNAKLVAVTLDTTRPTIVITTPVHKAIVKALSVSGTAVEPNLAKVEVTLTRKVGATTQYWAKRGTTFSWGTNALTIPAVFGGKSPNITWNVASANLPSGANLVEGPHVFKATATDIAGNSNVSSSQPTVTVDTTAPVIAITAPANRAVITAFAPITGPCIESYLSKVDVTLSRTVGTSVQYWAKRGSAFSWGADALTIPALLSGTSPNRTWLVPAKSLPGSANLADGPHTIRALATDIAGRTGVTPAYIVTVDKTAPATVVITEPTANATLTSLAKVAGTATDNTGGSGIERVDLLLRRGVSGAFQYWGNHSTTSTPAYSWAPEPAPLSATLSGTGWGRTTNWPTGANLPPAKYTLLAMAIDKAGNTLNATPVTFTVPEPSAVVRSDEAPAETPDTATEAKPSAIMLSSLRAKVSPAGVVLVFTGPLAASSTDPTRFTVRSGDTAISVESVQMTGAGTLALGLEENSLHAGDAVTVTFELKDTRGLRVAGSARTTAR